ncbi:DUF6161 domain-containing protein [Pelagibacterium lentulum]|uniref:DUF6161 domain-containing protein n=1 Tax=Pelagibacterium lentulum TaxID=2029865 RepID=A0A916RDJ8_9HYPH|nr:DUF6161 domain-containing protein [Pelagibacterium lentulum]GGA51846.1 hypothetical protein GCM10011499_22360 [Pelagibacterium lentulum]
MSEATKPLIQFQPMGTEPIILKDKAEAKEFLNSEQNCWQWLQSSKEPDADKLHQYVQSQFRALHQGLARNQFSQLEVKFTKTTIPTSRSTLFQFIETVRANDEKLAIAIAGLTWGMAEIKLGHPMTLAALSSLVTFCEGVTPESAAAIRTQLDEVLARYKRSESATRGWAKRLESELDASRQTTSRVVSLGRRYAKHKLRFQRKSDDARIESAIGELNETRRVYMEYMALSAPVSYWQAKAASHRKREGTLKNVAICYALGAGIVVVVALFCLAKFALQAASQEAHTSVLLIYAGIGVVITTIGFWIGRVITRLYLSEAHLAVDAEERATMVQTYLALTNVNQASAEDRTIVLASLFRPTEDGIVKDDGAPDFSAAGVLSRFSTSGGG